MAVDELLPRQKLLDREGVPLAGLLDRDQPGAHAGHDLRLAPDDPALGAWRRQIIQGHRRSLGADHGIRPTWTLGRHTLPSVIAAEAATCFDRTELTPGDFKKH